jgi:hypothetical protein
VNIPRNIGETNFVNFSFFASETEQNYAKRRSLPILGENKKRIRQHQRLRGTADLLRIRSISIYKVELPFRGTYTVYPGGSSPDSPPTRYSTPTVSGTATPWRYSQIYKVHLFMSTYEIQLHLQSTTRPIHLLGTSTLTRYCCNYELHLLYTYDVQLPFVGAPYKCDLRWYENTTPAPTAMMCW